MRTVARAQRALELLGCCLVALIALAGSGAYAAESNPDQLVSETVRDVQQIIRQDPALRAGDQRKTLDLVEKKILPHFDFERMTMLAVGRDWERATADQRQALVNAFRGLLVRTYSGALAAYKDHKVDIKPSKGETGDSAVVRTQVSASGAPPVLMDYRMHRTSGGWKVQDVAVEGVSLVTTYRSTFKAEIDRNGFDGLIKLIAAKSSADPLRTSSNAPDQKAR